MTNIDTAAPLRPALEWVEARLSEWGGPEADDDVVYFATLLRLRGDILVVVNAEEAYDERGRQWHEAAALAEAETRMEEGRDV